MSTNDRKLVVVLILLLLSLCAYGSPAKNVILMISDGAGFNTFHAADYYQHGALGHQPYDNFPVKLACTTYSLRSNGEPTGYDPQRFWSEFGKSAPPTDSAAAATALYTGAKTSNGRVCTDVHGKRLTTIAEIADSLGKATGDVTTVTFAHATPACVWSFNESRNNYEAIARQMIYESRLNVIMGCGHPHYDKNGRLKPQKDWEFAHCGSKELFEALLLDGAGGRWTFLDNKDDFEYLATTPNPPFDRVFGLAPVYKTLQQNRSGNHMGNPNSNVPDLPTMTKGALNVLAKDKDGFFLMIEGGAVDWANHAGQLERMIEEQVDFNRAIEAVVTWIEHNSSWNETLLIITADHECGNLWGPDCGGKGPDAFKLPTNNGKEKLPSATHYSGGHTNALVPLYAKGCGSETLWELVDGTDRIAAEKWNFDGRYVDNTDLFTTMHKALTKE